MKLAFDGDFGPTYVTWLRNQSTVLDCVVSVVYSTCFFFVVAVKTARLRERKPKGKQLCLKGERSKTEDLIGVKVSVTRDYK